MIAVSIADFGDLQLEHTVLDYNGTIAAGGELTDGVADIVRGLAEHLTIHVLTADTFGSCHRAVAGLPVTVSVLQTTPEDQAKLEYVEDLGPGQCVCMGNGRNDRLMLQSAALGIAVIGREGAALEALQACDIVVNDIKDALQLLVNPVRIRATLRS